MLASSASHGKRSPYTRASGSRSSVNQRSKRVRNGASPSIRVSAASYSARTSGRIAPAFCTTPEPYPAHQWVDRANIARVPLRGYLAGLVVLFILGAGAAALYGRTQAADDAREAATADARFGARLAASETGKGVAQLKATVAGAAANPGIAQAYAKPKDCALAFGGTDAYTTGHIDLIRTDGSVVCSSAKETGSYAQAPWLQQVLRQPVLLAPAPDPVTGKQVVLAAAPIPKRGAIVAVFNLEGVGPSLRATYGGPRKLEFLLTDGAKVITRSRDPVHGIGQPLPQPRDSRLYASAPVAGTSWRIYSSADKAQA